MPSSRELAANIWLTNDYVDTCAHKPINQTLPLQTNRVQLTAAEKNRKLCSAHGNDMTTGGQTCNGKFPCLLLIFVFLKI